MPRLPTPREDPWGDILVAFLSVSLAADGAIKPGAVHAITNPDGTTTFSANGAIVTTGEMPATTTFGTDGSITTVYGPPVSKTAVTTFSADGSITETVS